MGDPDPYRILLVAAPSEAHRLKQRLSGARGPFTIEEFEERELGSSAAPTRLADRRTDLILIGETVVNPLAAAQKARTSTPGQVLFLVPRERLGRFRAGLPFVPNLASAWTADADGEDLELGELVTEAARGARERAAIATAFGRINLQLAAPRQSPGERLRRAQLALSEQYLATLLTQSPDGFVAADRDGTVVALNEAASRLLGLGPDRLGAPVAELFPAEARDTVRRLLREAETSPLVREEVPLPGETEDLQAELSVAPVRDGAGGQAGVSITLRDVTERRRVLTALRESEDHYRHTVELNPQVAWTAAPDGQFDHVGKRWRELTGTSGLGSTWVQAIHPEDLKPTMAAWSRAVSTGEPYDIEHRVRLRDGQHHWMRSRAFPRRDGAGPIVKWYGATEDIHERRLAEDHLKLMVDELNHRVKNNLATVQAIAMQTLRGEDVPSARAAFVSRLLALAAAHDVLTKEQWEGAQLKQVATGVLTPLCGSGDRLVLDGPATPLSPKAALSIAMALHELCTNAVKYGALSSPEGGVVLHWDVQDSDAEPWLRLRWTEHGGPPVEPPKRTGFGSRLLERGVAAELRGRVKLDYRPEGLVCLIEAPLQEAGRRSVS